MIKLIATDIDGTLVKDSSPEIYNEMIEMIRYLRKQGIIFVVASGRQYASIRNMFQEVADEIVYIAENGAHIIYQGKSLSVTEMVRADAEEIIKDMRRLKKEGCELLASTTEGSYMETDNQDFIDLIQHSYRNEYHLVEDVLKEDITIIKASLYRKSGLRDIGEGILIPKWEEKVKVCMAGEEWVDFMDKKVDKGNALMFLQEYFGISKEETMAFGDNNNDVGLVSAAGESYAVENAVSEVKEQAKYICPSYEKKGVFQVLKSLYWD